MKKNLKKILAYLILIAIGGPILYYIYSGVCFLFTGLGQFSVILYAFFKVVGAVILVAVLLALAVGIILGIIALLYGLVRWAFATIQGMPL